MWYNDNAIATPDNLLTWPTRLAESRIAVMCTLPGEPASKARPKFSVRGGRVQTYNPAGPQAAQDALGWEMKAALRALMADDGHSFGVRAWFFSGNLSKRDVDNMLKLVCDAATGVVWKDDSQVSEVHARVVRDHGDPRTEVIIYTTGDVPRRQITCAACGRKRNTYKSWGARNYCSRACYNGGGRKGSVVPCKHCGSEVYRSQKRLLTDSFCSGACRDRHSSRETRCAQCQRVFRLAKTRRAAKVEFCGRGCAIAYYRARPPKIAVGTCTICRGGTARREYTRCRACSLEQRAELTSNYWTRTP